jgi:putative tryptophan/tyrosine transport system substrate-binding protein
MLAACGSSEGASDSGVKKIAYLRSVSTPGSPVDEALIDELVQRGFVEGENLAILGGSGNEVFPDPDKAKNAVQEWEEEGVDVIIAYSTSGAEIARDHAPGAKVLFLANDPQAAGFVKDERRPEGRMTGVTFRIPADRMLSLARRIMPNLQRIGLAYPPSDPAAVPSRDQFALAAQDQGMELISEEFTDASDLPQAVGKLVQEGRVELLLASVSPTATRAIPQLAEAAAAYRIPFAANVATAQEALLTVSPDSASIGSQLGRQAARLLNGASPATVPVEDPRRFNIGLNQRVAQDLGIQLPADVVREADVVHN